MPGDIWRDGSVGRAYDNHKYHQDGCTGFLMMKFVLQQNTDRSQPQHWPFMRFAEVLLNCAEAYNEADGGPSDKAYAWVNAVRARVGLPGLPEGLSQEEFRKALILERELEFGFEEVRWFDMVRWGLVGLHLQGEGSLSAAQVVHQLGYQVVSRSHPRDRDQQELRDDAKSGLVI